MSKPVKKKTRTKKSLGRGSRWQKGTLAVVQNRNAQTSDFLVPGASTQGRWNPGKSRAEQGEQDCMLVGFFMIRLVVVGVSCQ